MPPPRSSRRGYLDWLRGVAVVIMIAAHILDSWTRFEDRDLPIYKASMIVAGFGAPLFLFLAGVAVALSAGSKARRSGDAARAARAVAARGLQIFGLAFLFRLQAMIVSWGSWMSLLKVDILNIMGPAIMGAAALWRFGRTTRGRALALLLATLAIACLTPPVRAIEWLHVLPDPLEGYVRPRPRFTHFSFFPWAAFVTAGAFVGIFIDQPSLTIKGEGCLAVVPKGRRRSSWLPRAPLELRLGRLRQLPAETRLNIWLGAGGLALAAGSYAASYLPSPFERSDFWTSSPAFFLLRTGILVASIGLAYAWQQGTAGALRFSPLQQMGRTSLFIYWIHIELIYGLMVRPLHKSLTVGQAWLGIVIFSVCMLMLSLLKDRLVASWRAMQERESLSAVGGEG